MDHRLKSYLRPHRRRFGFSQREIAFLIGINSRTAVSLIERSRRRPSLDAIVICAFVFDASPAELFPSLILELHQDTLRRANDLYEELQGNPSKTTRVKLDFLEHLLTKSQGNENDARV